MAQLLTPDSKTGFLAVDNFKVNKTKVVINNQAVLVTGLGEFDASTEMLTVSYEDNTSITLLKGSQLLVLIEN